MRNPVESLGLSRAPEDCQRFFSSLFSLPLGRAKRVAYDLAINHHTLSSRFCRAGLPGPKRYVAAAMIVRAAERFAAGGSPDSVAYDVGMSSHQSLHRLLRAQLGVSVAEFRRDWTPARAVDRFRRELVEPYAETLGAFNPLLVDAHRPRPDLDPAKRNRAPARVRSTPAIAGILSLALLVTTANGCHDVTSPGRCTTSTRADSVAFVAGVDTTWVPVTITVEVCR